MTWRRLWLGLCLALALAPASWALEVRQAIWEFDGRVVPGHFNPVSVLLHNPSPTSFDGSVMVHKEAAGSRLGARLAMPCFIAPFSSRWVQFNPYLTAQDESWMLGWGKGPSQRAELPTPRIGPPAIVLLEADDIASRPVGNLRTFPASLFPPSVAATGGLEAVVLDHKPPWEPVRRQAFLHWLRRGGKLHLLQMPSGRYPQFDGDLAVLNGPVAWMRLEAGSVVRHPLIRSDLDAQNLADEGIAPHEQPNRTPNWSSEGLYFQQLRQFIRPNHHWTLIYATAVAFLVLIGPVHWWLSRRRFGYRLSILFLLGVVVLFGSFFFSVGRRGHGERARVHSIGHARPLGDGLFDVTHYLNAFVTRGDHYRITHGGTHDLYSTAQQFESVNGLIHNGRNGSFLVDMPLFSSRAFVHRGTMRAPEVSVRVVQWPWEHLTDLILAPGEGFPQQVVEVWALHKTEICHMELTEGQIKASRRSDHYQHVLDVDNLRKQGIFYGGVNPAFIGRGFYDESEPQIPIEQRFLPLIKPMMADILGVVGHDEPAPLTHDDQVKLFVFARSPEDFKIQSKALGEEISYVLYHLDVFEEK